MDTLTTREAARILGVSRRTFNRWIGTHAVERETSYGASGVEYRYTRSALEHLVHQVRGGEGVSQLDEGMPTGRASQPAQGRQDETSGAGQDEAPARVLALPAVEVLRPFVEEVGALREEVRQLREVLVSLRLPAPSTPTAAPRVRWRACVEVALLGGVFLLAGGMVAAVARVLQVNGVLPW